MKTMLLALGIAGLCASSVFAQGPLSTELKQSYAMVKGNITKGAAKVADADYSFKATPQVRTFGEIVTHIADVQGALCATAKGDGKKFGPGPTDKAGAMAYLKSVFDYCDPIYDSLTDQNGLEMVKMFGRDRTKYGTLEFGIQHDNEMYGTMVVYLRLKGLVPPSSEGRGMEGGGKK
jgi:hypothetical protein